MLTLETINNTYHKIIKKNSFKRYKKSNNNINYLTKMHINIFLFYFVIGGEDFFYLFFIIVCILDLNIAFDNKQMPFKTYVVCVYITKQ